MVYPPAGVEHFLSFGGSDGGIVDGGNGNGNLGGCLVENRGGGVGQVVGVHSMALVREVEHLT